MTVTTALGGCTWAGGGAGAGTPSIAVSAWSPRDNLPPGLPGSSLWTTHVTWARVDAIRTGLPARMQWPPDTAIPGPPLDMVAAAGNVVVVATVRSGTATPDVVTLRFINARTGALIASRSLPVWDFTGIRADSIGGEPVVEARYALTAKQGTFGELVDTVFDTSGRQVWTGGGRAASNYIGAGFLVNDAGTLVTGGHTLWFNSGTDALNHGSSYTVKDLSGRGLLTIPRWATVDPANPLLGTINVMQLVGGYAVVIHGGPGKTAADAPHVRFTVYDLSRGAKVVAAPTVTFPEGPNLVHPTGGVPNPDPEAHVVAACGGKLVLTLTDASWSGPSSMRVTVLDIATGRTTPPVDVPSVRNSRVAGVLSGLADAACTTMILNGPIVVTGPVPVPTSIAIDLSKGTLLWHRPALDVTYHYLSIHGGVIYALRDPTLTTPGRLIAIASGATLGAGFTAVPLAYTADGTPIFAKVPNDPAPASPSPSPSARGFYPQQIPRLSPTVDVQVWAGQPTT